MGLLDDDPVTEALHALAGFWVRANPGTVLELECGGCPWSWRPPIADSCTLLDLIRAGAEHAAAGGCGDG